MRPYVQTYHVCFGKENVHVKTNLGKPARELDQNQDKKILFYKLGISPALILRLAKMKETGLPDKAILLMAGKRKDPGLRIWGDEWSRSKS